MYHQRSELIMLSTLLLVLALNSNHESVINSATKDNSAFCKNNYEKKESKGSKDQPSQLEDIF